MVAVFVLWCAINFTASFSVMTEQTILTIYEINYRLRQKQKHEQPLVEFFYGTKYVFMSLSSYQPSGQFVTSYLSVSVSLDIPNRIRLRPVRRTYPYFRFIFGSK